MILGLKNSMENHRFWTSMSAILASDFSPAKRLLTPDIYTVHRIYLDISIGFLKHQLKQFFPLEGLHKLNIKIVKVWLDADSLHDEILS
jgi:hypothetical protein